MDRPFALFLAAGSVVMFTTVWTVSGIAVAPPPPPVAAPPVPMPSGPAHPDAASPETIPIRVDTGTAPLTGGSLASTPAGTDDAVPNPTLPGSAPAPASVPMPASPPPPTGGSLETAGRPAPPPATLDFVDPAGAPPPPAGQPG